MNKNEERFAVAAKEQWSALVNLVLDGSDVEALAKDSSMNPAVVKRKRDAIRFKHEQGFGREVIIANGQHWTLSSYARAKKNGDERQRILRWRVPASLADCIQNDNASPDAEEALVTRLHRVLGLETSESFWMFLHSWFSDLTDADLLHHGGEGKLMRRKVRHE